MAEDSDNALLPRIGGGGGIPAPVLVDPLNTQNRGIQSAKGLWDIRGLQAQEAWGNILQQSTDANGNVDYGKAQAAAAKNPMATMGMMSALKDTSGLRTGQFNLNTAQNNSVNSAVTAALAESDPERMKQVVYEQIQRQVQMGLIPLDRAMTALHNMSTDPAEMRRQLEAIRIQTLPEKERQDWIYGTRPAVQAGGATVFPSVPRPGADQPVVAVPHTMDPATAGGKVEWVDKTGTKHQGTGAQWAVEHGAGNTVGTPTIITTPGPGASGGAAPPAIPTQPLPGAYQPRGGTPGAPATPGATAAPPATPAGTSPPTAPAAPASPAVAAAPPPSGYTSTPGPAPGTTQAGEATGTASAGMATELIKRADQVPANKANYANMLADLDRLGKMPPGGERQIAIETFIKKATGYHLTMTEDEVAAGNSFAKLANIAVGQQLAAMGATDSRQQLFMGSNPSLDLSKLGNQQIIHMLQGNEDAIAAKSRAWQDWRKSGKGDDSYGDFQNDFNHHFDPRVFQQQYMDKKEIDTLRSSLETTPGAKQKFLDDLAYARSHKWVR